MGFLSYLPSINFVFLAALVLLVVRVILSIKKGFTKELVSFVSTIIASVAVLLIALAIRNYIQQDRIVFIVILILLLLLGVVYKIINLFLVSIKLIAKLPVIRVIDKPLGVIVGILETIVVIWSVYCLVIIFKTGVFGMWIYNGVANSKILTALYEYNYLYSLISMCTDQINKFDIFGLLGM